MRRADRLFQIIQFLHHTRPVTAKKLAEELEVSERTIYRDIQDLMLSDVPVYGEPGTGYRLLKGFQMPPLMFDREELAALLLGMKMVRAWTDPLLAKSAHHALKKIEAVIPESLKPELTNVELNVPDYPMNDLASDQLSTIRHAIKDFKTISFHYTRLDEKQSTRTVRPLGLFYWGKVWTLVAWCELRNNFRHFRLDRIDSCQVNDQQFENNEGQTLQDFLENEWGVC